MTEWPLVLVAPSGDRILSSPSGPAPGPTAPRGPSVIRLPSPTAPRDTPRTSSAPPRSSTTEGMPDEGMTEGMLDEGMTEGMLDEGMTEGSLGAAGPGGSAEWSERGLSPEGPASM